MRQLAGWTALIVLGLSVISFAAVALLRDRGALQWLELLAYDLFVRTRAADAPAQRPILVVGVTETDLNRWGWPLSDEILARVLTRLIDAEARVVGVDIYRDRAVPPGAERLGAVLRGNDKIVWVTKFGDRRSPGVPPPEALRDTDQVGFADILQDSDGIVRRAALFLDDGRTVSYAFPLRIALRYLAGDDIRPGRSADGWMRLDTVTLRPLEQGFGAYARLDPRGYQIMLDFAAGAMPYERVSLTRLLEGDVASLAVRGRIVLVGLTADSVKDFFFTPFSRGESVDQTLFGVALQAQIVDQLLRHARDGTPPTRSTDPVDGLVLMFAAAVLGGLAVMAIRATLTFIIVALLATVAQAAAAYIAFLEHLWLPVVPVLLSWTLAIALTVFFFSRRERALRSVLARMFASYVSGRIAEEIWDRRDEFFEQGRPRPQRQMATALFSDIAGFTAISERLEPQALMDWLNEYMDVMASLVDRHQGVIEKFAGDGITAYFGVPVVRHSDLQIREDVENAARCALDMKYELGVLNFTWSNLGLPYIRIRIGINTGPMVVGSLGSKERMQYSALGDTVNIAARLESLGKEVGETDGDCQILVSEATAELLGPSFERRYVGRFRLRGKEEEVGVYRLLRTVEAVAPEGDAL